jgi:hypothetical protein
MQRLKKILAAKSTKKKILITDGADFHKFFKATRHLKVRIFTKWGFLQLK